MKRARLVPARMCPRPGLARRAGAPGKAWTPVALGWRKAARALASLPGRPAGWTMRQSWSPRFHLHFAIHAGAPRAAPGKAAQGTPATTILWRRIDARLSRLLPVVRTNSTRGWRTVAHRVEQALFTRWRTRRETGWSEIVRTLRAAAPAIRPGASTATFSTSTVFRRLPAAGTAPPPASRPPLRLEPRLPRPRRPAAPPARSGRLAAAPRAPVRPAELVWRAEVEERSAQAAERVVRAAAASIPPLPAAAAAPPSWPPAQAVEALRPRLIDGALIDRLAEDVIGRVEKKIRIERERRGV